MTCDVVCHGVPSPGLFSLHLRWLASEEGSAVIGYSHRDKSFGWGHWERVAFEDGRAWQGTRRPEAWKRLFYSNSALRPSCYRCRYSTVERGSDVTIADFWGVEATPIGPDDGLGTSLVLANTPAGVDALSRSGLLLVPAGLLWAMASNPMLARPSRAPEARRELWETLRKRGYACMLEEGGFSGDGGLRSLRRTVDAFFRRMRGTR